MSSPFKTFEEFSGAIDGPTGGAIYTFAHTPAINHIALLVSVGLFIWFIIKSYSTYHELPPLSKSLNSLMMFLIAGLLSLVATQHRQGTYNARVDRTASHTQALQKSWTRHLGFLGLSGYGMSVFYRPQKLRSRKRTGRRIHPLHFKK